MSRPAARAPRWACLFICLTAVGPLAAQVPSWAEQGPNSIRGNGNQSNITPNSTVSGAANSIALDPNNANNAVAGTVNGGLWRTTDAGATWTPTTDNNGLYTSMSFGAVSYDATTANVLVAGYGRTSSFGGSGGAQAGLLRSTNGGATWTAINGTGAVSMRQHNVFGVYANGNTIVASTTFSDTNNSYGNIGVLRSSDGGATYSVVSGNGPGNAPNGLPGGYSFGLTGRNVGGQDVLLTATQFANVNGIYRSTNGGATWTLASASSTGLSTLFLNNNVINAKFSFGPNNTAWAALANGSGIVSAVYRSTDNGATWANTSLNTTFGGNSLNPGQQGGTHISITADPTDSNIVYVGGDRTPGSPFAAQMFRINASTNTVSLFTNADTSNNSNPHADTRSLGFDAAGRVWLGSDGGVYRRDNVTPGAGQWISLNPGLRSLEVTGVAYDTITKSLITGQQDNGTSVMNPNVNVNTPFASKIWTNILSGDGGKPASDPLTVGGSTLATNTTRYFSFQFLGQSTSGFFRAQYNATNTLVGGFANPTLTVGGQNLFAYENGIYPNLNGIGLGSIQFLQPLAVNKVNGGRLYIGTRRMYESTNQGNNLTDLNGDLAVAAGFANNPGAHGLNVNAMSAGGRTGATLQPNVLYVGTSSVGTTNLGGHVFSRPASGSALGAMTHLPAYSTAAGTTFENSAVQALTMDTFNWQNVYVAAPKRIWLGNVAANASSSTWSDFTGNLTPGGSIFTEPTGMFTSLAFVPSAGSATRGAVIVGTSGGLYWRYNDGGANTWLEFGGADMPDAFISQLEYDFTDDILIASTLGRGVWTLPNASQLFAVPEPTVLLGVGLLAVGWYARRRRAT